MNSNEWLWSDLRDRAIAGFEQMPPAADEHELLEAFQKHPVAVNSALEHVLDRYKQGKIRRPWRIWVDECRSRGNVSVDVGPDREKYLEGKLNWMHTAGMHFDRWEEVYDELFGDRGSLKAWAGDPTVVARMKDAWEEARPMGIQLEEEHVARMAEWKLKTKMGPATHKGHAGTGLDRIKVP